MHKLAGRDLPPSAADEMKEELDDLEAEAEMTQETLDIDLLLLLIEFYFKFSKATTNLTSDNFLKISGKHPLFNV